MLSPIREGRLWNEFVARYHYLGYKILVGARMRYTGAVYRASGWLRVGTTQRRSRYDRDKLYDKPSKDVWLRPLRRDWRRALNR